MYCHVVQDEVLSADPEYTVIQERNMKRYYSISLKELDQVRSKFQVHIPETLISPGQVLVFPL